MNPTFKEIQDYVSETTFDNEPMQLDPCTTINNKTKFAESHVKALEGNPKNKTFLPYFLRLQKFYNILNRKS